MDLFDETKLAHEFNSFLTNVRKNLASKIPNASTLFEYFANNSDFVMETKALSIIESIKAHAITMLVVMYLKNALTVCVNV